MNNIGLIAANTSRTRAYIAALERNNIFPKWVLVLDDISTGLMPGQIARPVSKPSIVEADRAQDCWSETEFDQAVDILEWLERRNIPYAVTGSKDINDPVVALKVAESAPSVLIYSGYGGAILRREILETGKQFLHVHGGYLPDFKGSTTNYYSLLTEGALGASAIFLTTDIDCGPILIRRKFPIPANPELIDHIYDSAARAKVLIDTLHLLMGSGIKNIGNQENNGGNTYYIIHPVLKHIAILQRSF